MLTKLERLKQAVVDIEAAWDAYYPAWDADYAAWDADADAFDAWVKAKRELASYLKEQDDD